MSATSRIQLGRTVPALSALDVAESVGFYRERLGFDVVHHDGGGEFATLDRDGNLVTFFVWVER